MEIYYDGKPSNSETSSEENDQAAEKFTDENAGVGRFYECTFCKRGFTNAQALGGHMNIHRKNKAKAKQKARQCSITNKSNEEFMNSRNNDKFSNEQSQYCAVPTASQMNYQRFFPGSNPNFSQGCDHLRGDFAHPRQEHLSVFGYHHDDPSLSTHIDHRHPENSESCRKDTRELEENELDLELRLG